MIIELRIFWARMHDSETLTPSPLPFGMGEGLYCGAFTQGSLALLRQRDSGGRATLICCPVCFLSCLFLPSIVDCLLPGCCTQASVASCVQQPGRRQRLTSSNGCCRRSSQGYLKAGFVRPLHFPCFGKVNRPAPLRKRHRWRVRARSTLGRPLAGP